MSNKRQAPLRVGATMSRAGCLQLMKDYRATGKDDVVRQHVLEIRSGELDRETLTPAIYA